MTPRTYLGSTETGLLRGIFARRHWLLLTLVTVATIAGTTSVSRIDAQAGTTDLSRYYPNTSMIGGYFLEGYNYRTSPPDPPTYAVLWYEAQDRSHFKQYNSMPGTPSSRCHWDQWQISKVLSYSETNHTCDSVNDIRYNGPIAYMPRNWGGAHTIQTGRSSANFYNNGVLACSGYIDWTGEVLGWEAIGAGVSAIHDRLTSTTHWTSGSDPSGCFAGGTDRYQENLYLVDQLPIAGSTATARGLKRSVGGSLGRYDKTKIWDWDIWFDRWQRLPAHP